MIWPLRHEVGFTRVDRRSDPARWVRALDTLRPDPFYAAYKPHALELLSPKAKHRFLEVGAGAATGAASGAAQANVWATTELFVP